MDELNDALSTADLRSQLAASQVLAVRMSTLNRLSIELNGASDIEDLASVIAENARWLIDFDICGVALLDRRGHITFRLLIPFDVTIWSVIPGSPLDGGLRMTRTVATDDALADTDAEFAWIPGIERPVRSWLHVPLRAGDHYEGAFFCGTHQAFFYKSDDIHIAHMFGAHLGAAIQRTRLNFQILSEHANSATLYQVLGELSTLTSGADLVSRLVESAVLITGAERGSLLLFEEPASAPSIVYTWPHQPEPLLDPAVVVADPLFVQLQHQTQPIAIEDTLVRPWRTLLPDEETARSVLGVALSHQGRRAGLLLLSHDEPYAFEDDHASLIQTLARQVAIMLENVRFNEQQRRLFHQYVPSPVAASLLENPALASLGGQRQTISIFFADIANFTTFSEDHSPEELIRVLNGYFGIVADTIQEYGGTLDKFMGDAVMAIFNAPQPQPNHALRTARAALHIQRLIETYHRLVVGQERLFFRIGLHTGEAVVGNIGAHSIRNYTAIGDTVNTAKRIQEAGQPGEILISATFADALGPAATIDPAGTFVLKGKADPVPLYRLKALP